MGDDRCAWFGQNWAGAQVVSAVEVGFFVTFRSGYIADVWGGILAMKGGVRGGTTRQKQQRLS